MEKCETFDPSKAHYLIQNWPQYENKMAMSNPKDTVEYDYMNLLKRYLDSSIDGKITVNYKQNYGHGRYFAVNSLSLQCMPKQIRHTISRDYYIDIDMINAHPTILEHICKGLNITCRWLSTYNNNRDKCLTDITNHTREQAKQVFLAVMNGGIADYKKVNKKSKTLVNFKKEVRIIHTKLADKYPEKYDQHKSKREAKGIDKNHKASFMNVLICVFENTILQAILSKLGDPEDAVLCFDGVMVRANTPIDIPELESFVHETTKIKIGLVIKPMNDHFILPECKPYVNPIEYFADFRKLIGDNIPLTKAKYWKDNTLICIENDGDYFLLTKNKRIDCWTKEKSIYYTPRKVKKILDTLSVKCNIINYKYDAIASKQFLSLNSNDKKMVLLNNPVLADVIDRHAFQGLGFCKVLGGQCYLRYVLENRLLPSFNRIEFFPYLKRKGEPVMYDAFNTFTGFPMENIELQSEIKFENTLIYKHLKEEMLSGDINEFNHFLDFIADIVQCPHEIRGPSHLFYSVQGTGKGMMAHWLTRVLGSDNVISFSKTDQYFKDFNIEQTSKLLKLFEEVKDKGSAFNNHDILKADQTKTMERIEPKGMDSYQVHHCARFMYFTNNENALFIENDDRRHTMHKVRSGKADNTEYFKPIWEEVKNEQYCKSAFEFFAERKYEVKNVLKAYTTQYKLEQKEVNLPNGIKFIKELIEHKFESVPLENNKIKARLLSLEFKRWCDDNGCRYHVSAFKQQIKKIGLIDKMSRYDGSSYRCYHIDTNAMLEEFRTMLKNPNFEFEIVGADADNG
jgi:hypothetical protein